MRTAEEELLEGRHHTLDLVDVVEDAEQSELNGKQLKKLLSASSHKLSAIMDMETFMINCISYWKKDFTIIIYIYICVYIYIYIYIVDIYVTLELLQQQEK